MFTRPIFLGVFLQIKHFLKGAKQITHCWLLMEEQMQRYDVTPMRGMHGKITCMNGSKFIWYMQVIIPCMQQMGYSLRTLSVFRRRDLVVTFNHIGFVRFLLAQALLDDTCDACLSGKTASSPKKLKQTHHSKPQGKWVINQKKVFALMRKFIAKTLFQSNATTFQRHQSSPDTAPSLGTPNRNGRRRWNTHDVSDCSQSLPEGLGPKKPSLGMGAWMSRWKLGSMVRINGL